MSCFIGLSRSCNDSFCNMKYIEFMLLSYIVKLVILNQYFTVSSQISTLRRHRAKLRIHPQDCKSWIGKPTVHRHRVSELRSLINYENGTACSQAGQFHSKKFKIKPRNFNKYNQYSTNAVFVFKMKYSNN
jgi:hypothetical protein